MTPDLTPFGFTATESAAYVALLELGPATGYQVAKHIGVARANVYSALASLVTKRAGVVRDEEPRVFRATRPEDLVANLGRVAVSRIELLERQMASYQGAGAPSLESFSGVRQLVELAIRLATRDRDVVRFLGSAVTAGALLPVWRKRAADGLTSEVFLTEAAGGSLPVSSIRVVPSAEVKSWFGATPAVLSCAESAVVGAEVEAEPSGVWGSTPAVVGLARLAVAAIA